MIRVALAGHQGKTGSALVPGLRDAPDIEYVGGVGRRDDLGSFLRLTGAQVLVDFTHPAAARGNALAAVSTGAVPVVGTTGLPAEAVDELERACADARLGGIVAPNFAIGAVLMMHLAEVAAPFFDAAEVIEMHHGAKADAPSGTALATARRLADRSGGRFSYNRPERETMPNTRGGEERNVAVHSVRLPGLLADQEVMFGLPGQTLTVTHRTTSRECYTPGVLIAIRRLVAEPRFHRTLDSLLGLREVGR